MLLDDPGFSIKLSGLEEGTQALECDKVSDPDPARLQLGKKIRLVKVSFLTRYISGRLKEVHRVS